MKINAATNLQALIVVICYVGSVRLVLATSNDWWQHTVFYQIYPRSFKDSNNDGIGDLKGITDKLEYLKETGIGATWLSPIFESPMIDFGYDISNYKKIHYEYGTMEDFDELIAKANELGIKVILDFVPNHTSDQSEWFIKSVNREPGYEDYYVWRDGLVAGGGDAVPPNNWVSVFYGSAWTYHPVRKQFYLHQFTKEQPDLNFRNPKVRDEMKQELRFWLEKGVDGFRIDAVNHLFEDEEFRDEPASGRETDPLNYDFLDHIYTKDLLECYTTVQGWRAMIDEWTEQNGTDTKVIMTEAYTNITSIMKYYGDEFNPGAHIPFNFFLISELDDVSTAHDFINTINKWLVYMPLGQTANWVMGNHDKPRVGSRFGFELIDVMNMLVLTLPGIAITYQGEEIGMTDLTEISWEETKDPAALNTNPDVYKKYTRDPARTPFQWDNSELAGFTNATSSWLPINPNYRALNLASQQDADKSHYKLYQQLVKLRQRKSFREGQFRWIVFNPRVFSYIREYPGSETFVVLLNIGPEREIINLDAFVTLPETLYVEATGIRSTYIVGSLIPTRYVELSKHESLILKAPLLVKNSTLTILGAQIGIKDILLLSITMLAIALIYYSFVRCSQRSVSRTKF